MADDLQLLERDLETLRRTFELYFMGLEKRIPARLRDETTRKIRRYLPGKETVERFRYQTLVQRLLTLERYWGRITRQIEEGTYIRDRKRADWRAKKKTDKKEPVSAERQIKAKKKAAEAGDAAADFLASLGVTPAPVVAMRGQALGRSSRRSRPSVPSQPAPLSARGRPKRPSAPIKRSPPPVAPRGRPKRAPPNQQTSKPAPRKPIPSTPAPRKPLPDPAPAKPALIIPMRGRSKRDE